MLPETTGLWLKAQQTSPVKNIGSGGSGKPPRKKPIRSLPSRAYPRARNFEGRYPGTYGQKRPKLKKSNRKGNVTAKKRTASAPRAQQAQQLLLQRARPYPPSRALAYKERSPEQAPGP